MKDRAAAPVPLFMLVVQTLALLLAAPRAFAGHQANQFFEFDLPPGWTCAPFGDVGWNCQLEDPKKQRDAFIVLAAKTKNDQDSLESYLIRLSKPRAFKAPDGKPLTSQVKYATSRKFNNWVWVDSLHLGSELPGYSTRYLATVSRNTAVLITQSVKSSLYRRYEKPLEEIVASVKLLEGPAPKAAPPAAAVEGSPPRAPANGGAVAAFVLLQLAAALLIGVLLL